MFTQRFFHALCLVSLICSLELVQEGVAVEKPTPGSQTAQQMVVKTGSGDNVKEVVVRYWLFLPENYGTQKKLPLMLFLHGAGERGEELHLVKKWGPPKLVQQQKTFPFVVISPQCPKNKRWNAEQMVALVKDVADRYQVDQSRTYCTGLSMGGYGTWAIGAKYPDLFAALVPICGGGDAAGAKQLAKTPIWAFHGDKDKTVPLKRSAQMVAAIKEAGGDVKLTVYPGVGHNSWSATYANQQVYKWLLSKRRSVAE